MPMTSYRPRDPKSDDPSERYRGFVELESPVLPEDIARNLEMARWAAENVEQPSQFNASAEPDNLKPSRQPSTKDLLQCVLVEPTGEYRTAPGIMPRFDIQTSNMLSEAIKDMNEQKIVPVITSGYRSPEYQQHLRKSGQGITPARVSQHQVGAALDFGLNSNKGNSAAIQKAMEDAGFTWGGNFRRPDPVHYQSPPAGRSPDPEYVRACLRAIMAK